MSAVVSVFCIFPPRLIQNTNTNWIIVERVSPNVNLSKKSGSLFAMRHVTGGRRWSVWSRCVLWLSVLIWFIGEKKKSSQWEGKELSEMICSLIACVGVYVCLCLCCVRVRRMIVIQCYNGVSELDSDSWPIWIAAGVCAAWFRSHSPAEKQELLHQSLSFSLLSQSSLLWCFCVSFNVLCCKTCADLCPFRFSVLWQRQAALLQRLRRSAPLLWHQPARYSRQCAEEGTACHNVTWQADSDTAAHLTACSW